MRNRFYFGWRLFALGVVGVLSLSFAERSVVAQVNLPTTPALPLQAPVRRLNHDLDNIFNDPNFENAFWGVEVQSMETGEILYRLNANKSFLPASTFKAVTSAMAMALLGRDWHYTTQLITTSKPSGGVLRGDLIIRGSGDPTLGSALQYPDSSALVVLNAWADSLQRLGIKQITGAIIADDSYFTRDRYPLGWSIEDEPYYYAMQVSGLNFAENAVTVTVTPDSAHGVATVELSPDIGYLQIENASRTKLDSVVGMTSAGIDTVLNPGATTIAVSRLQGQNIITVEGDIPRSGQAVDEQISVDDPSLYIANAFKVALQAHGIEVTGNVEHSSDLPQPIAYLRARVLATYVSPALPDIIRVMNKHSDNLYAECLFRTVAKEMTGEGSWTKGAQVMKRFLNAVADTDGVKIEDGSGLSRMDLMTPAAMTAVLHHMYLRKSLWKDYYNSLPIMGVDGTLSNRLRGTNAEGNVHAKTGFLTEVRSLSGYLTDRDGELLGFTIYVNNHTAPVSLANNVQDLAIVRLVNFSRKYDPAQH